MHIKAFEHVLGLSLLSNNLSPSGTQSVDIPFDFVQHLDSIVEDTEGALQSVHQRSFTKWDVYNCKEAMLIGSTTYVTGIIQWDRKLLGDGVGGT